MDTILNDLALDIIDPCQNTYVKQGEFSISSIFKKMHEIFPQVVSIKPRGFPRFTLVIGDSGAGKSLHIGYLLDADIAPRKDGKLDYAHPDPKLPLVGHEPTSQTQGYQVYKKYIDCAGFHDTAGKDVDICNVMAMSMINQKFSPDRLIVVIPYTHLTGARPRLLDFIKELKKIINLNDDKVLLSTMFVFSDAEGLSAKTSPKLLLQRDIDGITATRNKELPERLKHWANKSLAVLTGTEKTLSEDLSKLEPAKIKKIMESNEEKEILERLMNQGNFMVFDLLTEDKLKTLNDQINHPKTGLKDKIATLKTEIKGLKFKVEQTTMQQRLVSSIYDLQKYETQQKEDIIDKKGLTAKLERYEEFRQLIGKIIDSLRDLDLAAMRKDMKKKLLKSFFYYFQNNRPLA